MNPHARGAGLYTAGMDDVDPERLTVVNYPHPVLTRVAEPVAEIDDRVRRVAERMIELMHERRGVGLAAPQVGLPWRMFVANPGPGEGDEAEAGAPGGGDRVYVNPKLVDAGAATSARDEGCLSLPGVTAEITRPVAITIEATDLDGQAFRVRSEAFAARVWQHEFDHLEGVLLLDRMTRVDRMANRRAVRELEAEHAG